jgi:hypothetical protein
MADADVGMRRQEREPPPVPQAADSGAQRFATGHLMVFIETSRR